MVNKKVIVLGAGLVGGPMAMDLSLYKDIDVSVADVNDAALNSIPQEYKVEKLKIDLSLKGNISGLVKDFDYVINAVPGFMGFAAVKEIISAGKDVVDIAFFPEEPYELDDLAKSKGVTCIVDCGVAPGMSHILTGYGYHDLDTMSEGIIYVGGLPKIREWPFEYKAGFSPIDVIEEYTRPSRIVEKGEVVIKPALSEPELINFPMIGTLEAFNSDGLRSLVKTIKIPDLKEKTLRYPGHIDKMKVLRETGFFSEVEVEVRGQKVRPIDMTAKLLFPKWKLEKGEIDFTVMLVEAKGMKNGEQVKHSFYLYDEADTLTGVHSMARTTGYTATTVLRMLIDGKIKRKGLVLPEFLGEDEENVMYLLSELEKKGIKYVHSFEKC